MRRMMLAAAIAAGIGGQAVAQDAKGGRWPDDGRIGIAAIVETRGHSTCRFNLILQNSSGLNFDNVSVRMEVFGRSSRSLVTDAYFRVVDHDRSREAGASIFEGCPQTPRITIRDAVCRVRGLELDTGGRKAFANWGAARAMKLDQGGQA